MNETKDPIDSLIVAAGIDADFGWLVQHALEQVIEILVRNGGVLREELADPEVQQELSSVKARLESYAPQYLDLYRSFLQDHFTQEQLIETAAAVQSEAVKGYLRCLSLMGRTLTASFQELGQRMLRNALTA